MSELISKNQVEDFNSYLELQRLAKRDLSMIAQGYVLDNMTTLRKLTPIFVSTQDVINDVKYITQSDDGSWVNRPVLADSTSTGVDSESIAITLTEKSKEVERDVRTYGKESEKFALQSATAPILQGIVREFTELLYYDGNYEADREVDVNASGDADNSWTSALTCEPTKNIFDALDKFYAENPGIEYNDPGVTLAISPYLAGLLTKSKDFLDLADRMNVITTGPRRDIMISAVFGISCVITHGKLFGNNSSPLYDKDLTCHIMYVDDPNNGFMDIDSYATNGSTFITAFRKILSVDEAPPMSANVGFKEWRKDKPDETLQMLRRNGIVASWTYKSMDKYSKLYVKSLAFSAVWIHDLKKLVRLKDIVV